MIKQLSLALCIGLLFSLPACKDSCCPRKTTEETTQTSVDAEVFQETQCENKSIEVEESAPAKF